MKTLENEAQIFVAKARRPLAVIIGDVLPVDGDGAARRLVEQTDDVEQGRFAATARSHDAEEFPGGHVQVDVAQGERFDGFGPVGLLDGLEMDHCLT